MTCPECGTPLLNGARFCHQCGWDSKLAAAGKASSTAGQRPAWKRWVISVTLGISTVLMLWLLLIPRTDADTTLMVGQAAPDFTLPALEGGPIHLASLRGKPVILNFWASWCTPCLKEMPDFQAVYDKYKDEGLQLYGINLGESRVAVNGFRERVGTTFPILLDLEEKVQGEYKILPIPATFFIDREGKIRAIYQYQMTRGQIEQEVEKILAQ